MVFVICMEYIFAMASATFVESTSQPEFWKAKVNSKEPFLFMSYLKNYKQNYYLLNYNENKALRGKSEKGLREALRPFWLSRFWPFL